MKAIIYQLLFFLAAGYIASRFDDRTLLIVAVVLLTELFISRILGRLIEEE